MGVILLCIVSVLAIACLYMAGRGYGREVKQEQPQGDYFLPPLDPGWEYREGLKDL